jgi:hypothetical protein
MEVINERLAYYEELESRNDLTDLGKHAKLAIQNLKRDVEYALTSTPSVPAQRQPMPADIAQIIKDGWHAGNGPDAVAAEILREFDAALTPADGGGK